MKIHKWPKKEKEKKGLIIILKNKQNNSNTDKDHICPDHKNYEKITSHKIRNKNELFLQVQQISK